jgi:hypothetical protein
MEQQEQDLQKREMQPNQDLRPEQGSMVIIEDRRQFFLLIGEALSEYPEAKMRVGKILEQFARANGANVHESAGAFAPYQP